MYPFREGFPLKGAIGLAKIEKTKLNEDDQKLTNEQTYDSALGAMVTKLREYIVPLVNEAFG